MKISNLVLLSSLILMAGCQPGVDVRPTAAPAAPYMSDEPQPLPVCSKDQMLVAQNLFKQTGAIQFLWTIVNPPEMPSGRMQISKAAEVAVRMIQLEKGCMKVFAECRPSSEAIPIYGQIRKACELNLYIMVDELSPFVRVPSTTEEWTRGGVEGCHKKALDKNEKPHWLGDFLKMANPIFHDFELTRDGGTFQDNINFGQNLVRLCDFYVRIDPKNECQLIDAEVLSACGEIKQEWKSWDDSSGLDQGQVSP